MNAKFGWFGVAVLVALSAVVIPARADYVELNDGTYLEGTVLKTKDGYWVKSAEGQTRKLLASEVKSTGKGAKPSKAKPGAATPGAGKSSSTKPSASAGSSDASASASATTGPKKARITDYATAERRASGVEVPLSAVAIWQEFIDSGPPSDVLEKAKAELDKWQKLADGGAEKIKGKWVSGDERKAIVKKARELYEEGARLMAGTQTLQAVEKLKESLTIYPNNFEANFELAYILMIQHNAKDAERYLIAAQRIRPASPEVMANLALIEIDRRAHVKAIEMLHKAAKQGDNKAIVQNLITAILTAPPASARNQKVVAATQDARLLASKHGVPEGRAAFIIVALAKDKSESPGSGDGSDGPVVGLSSGSGFIIAKDGLILTNKHVVEHGKSFLVFINGKKQRSAEVVVMDDEQDLALIRVKCDAGEELPIVQLSPGDTPGDGAACTVMGFPLIDRLGAAIKVTRGIVSSAAKQFEAGPDVMIDAIVNPGNSGGPILDKYGNVMAIVSMKTLATTSEDTYGLGISAGRIRTFLVKNKINVEKGIAGATELDAEAIATKVKPAAVCILATR